MHTCSLKTIKHENIDFILGKNVFVNMTMINLASSTMNNKLFNLNA